MAPTKPPHSDPREASHPLIAFERVLFGSLVVLIPFRLRLRLAPVEIPPIYADYTDVLLFASDAAMIALLLVWSLRRSVTRDRPSTGPWFITWPMLGFMAAGLVSAFGSVAPLISWMHVVRLTLLFVFYLYVVNELRRPADLLPWVAVQVGAQAAVAVTQFLLQRSIGLSALGELLLDPSWFGVSIVHAPGSIALRSYGLSDHPNILGGSLAFGLLFLLVMQPHWPRRAKTAMAFTAALGLTALLLTFSRAAWLGLAAGAVLTGLVLLVRRRPREIRKLALLTASALIVVLPFLLAVLPFLNSRLALPGPSPADEPGPLLSPEQRSITERSALLDAANQLFQANPVTGVGLGAFPIALLGANPDFTYNYQPVHFVLLDAAAEIGLFGALGYFLAILLPWFALWVARQRLAFSPALLAASAMLAAVTVIGLFDYYPWFLVTGRLWHWLIWGLWAAAFQVEVATHA